MKNTLYLLCFIFILFNSACDPKQELGLNENASSISNLGDLPENPLLLNAITTSIQPKDSTMSVLYGNDLAYLAAGEGRSYPVGAVLYEVTWQLQSDKQWFGANVAKMINTIERIEFIDDHQPQYTIYEEEGTRKSEPHEMTGRRNSIIRKKIALSP